MSALLFVIPLHGETAFRVWRVRDLACLEHIQILHSHLARLECLWVLLHSLFPALCQVMSSSDKLALASFDVFPSPCYTQCIVSTFEPMFGAMHVACFNVAAFFILCGVCCRARDLRVLAKFIVCFFYLSRWYFTRVDHGDGRGHGDDEQT